MKKIIILITLLCLLTSCNNEPVDFNPEPVDLNPINNIDYAIALDTLKNYSDYILGYYGEKFLISTNVDSRSYFGSVNSQSIDSSFVQINLYYKFLDNNVEKLTSLNLVSLESKTKLNQLNNNHYINFTDFVNFFNKDSFNYYRYINSIKNIPEVEIHHLKSINIDNNLNGYSSSLYKQQKTTENFSFIVDSINIIEQPIKKVEMYYSFKCIGTNFYDNELIMNSGKGKSTYIFN